VNPKAFKKSVLIVSPHPDDETLGAGGTLLKYKSAGYSISWLNVTHMSEALGWTPAQIQKRDTEIEAVKAFYGFKHFFNLDLKTTQLDTYPIGGIIDSISKIIQTIKPTVVILPYREDAHTEHRIVFDAVTAVTKTFRAPFIEKVLSMEILSETDYAKTVFSPNYFVDITDYMDRKIEAMKIYASEMGEMPFPRSETAIRALGTHRGAQSACQYAEAFQILKDIWK